MKKTTFTYLPLLLFSFFPAARIFAQPEFLDNNFGNAGRQTLTLPGYDWVGDLTILPDGKILVAGTSFHLGENRPCLTRYHANGVLDTSFGVAGKTPTLAVPAFNRPIDTVGLQSDGKILALGGKGGSFSQYLIRYLPNGFPDNTWPFPLELNTLHIYR